MIDSDGAVRDSTLAGLPTRVKIRDDPQMVVAPYLSPFRRRKTAP